MTKEEKMILKLIPFLEVIPIPDKLILEFFDIDLEYLPFEMLN